MTKLCPRGKAAAKRKFAVYPSAYANAYASKICAGKIKDPSGVKRKDFKGPKPAGKKDGGIMNSQLRPPRKFRPPKKLRPPRKRRDGGTGKPIDDPVRKREIFDQQKFRASERRRKARGELQPMRAEGGMIQKDRKGTTPGRQRKMKGSAIEGNMKMMKKRADELKSRKPMMGGGMTMMPRAMYGKGGGVCKRGMGRAYGKNS